METTIERKAGCSDTLQSNYPDDSLNMPIRRFDKPVYCRGCKRELTDGTIAWQVDGRKIYDGVCFGLRTLKPGIMERLYLSVVNLVDTIEQRTGQPFEQLHPWAYQVLDYLFEEDASIIVVKYDSRPVEETELSF